MPARGIAGAGTGEFSKYAAGDDVSILGTLGNGFPIAEAEGKKVFLIGSGIGVPQILEMAKKNGLEKVHVHGFLDGRDVPPSSAADFAEEMVAKIREIGVGDIAENGLSEEYQLVYDGLKGLEGCRYIMSAGNHDIRLRLYKQVVKRFTEFSNALNNNVDPVSELHFSEVINGYKFIVLGSDKATFEEPLLAPIGIEYVLIGGKVALKAGEIVSDKLGKAIRK